MASCIGSWVRLPSGWQSQISKTALDQWKRKERQANRRNQAKRRPERAAMASKTKRICFACFVCPSSWKSQPQEIFILIPKMHQEAAEDSHTQTAWKREAQVMTCRPPHPRSPQQSGQEGHACSPPGHLLGGWCLRLEPAVGCLQKHSHDSFQISHELWISKILTSLQHPEKAHLTPLQIPLHELWQCKRQG